MHCMSKFTYLSNKIFPFQLTFKLKNALRNDGYSQSFESETRDDGRYEVNPYLTLTQCGDIHISSSLTKQEQNFKHCYLHV